MIFVFAFVLDHAGCAGDYFFGAGGFMFWKVFAFEDVSAVLTFDCFLFTVYLKMVSLIFSFNLLFAILTRNFAFSTFFSIMFLHVFAFNYIFTKATNNEWFWTFLKMLYCFFQRLARKSIKTSKWAKQFFVTAYISMSN